MAESTAFEWVRAPATFHNALRIGDFGEHTHNPDSRQLSVSEYSVVRMPAICVWDNFARRVLTTPGPYDIIRNTAAHFGGRQKIGGDIGPPALLL
jgi:hypothetical protein